MALFGDLEARVSADTDDFERGIDSAERSLTGMLDSVVTAAGSLRRLEDAADEAGDKISSAGRSAARTSGLFAVLSATTSGLGVSFGGATTSVTGFIGVTVALTGAVTGLLSVLFPLAAIVGTLTAGLGALAAAFGTVIGTGIIAFGQKRGEQNQKRLEEVRARIEELEALSDQQNNLTEAQEEELETLKAIKDQRGELTLQQRQELRTLRELENEQFSLTDTQEDRLNQLEAIEEQSGRLTDAQQDRLSELENVKEAQTGLNEAQQEELEQLEEQEKKLKDQVGVMGGLESAIADVRAELVPIITDFGEKFVPLIEDAIDAIPQLVRNIFAAIGGLGEFRRSLRRFGQAAFEAIPDVAAGIIDLARRALPVLQDILQWFDNNAGMIFNEMVRVTKELAPVFTDFLRAFIDATPGLTKLGSTILETVVPAVTDLINTIDDLLSDVDTDNPFDALITMINNGLNRVETFLTEEGGKEQIQNLLIGILDQIGTAFGEGQDKLATDMASSLSNTIGAVFDALLVVLTSDEAGRASQALGAFAAEMISQIVDAGISYVVSEDGVRDMIRLADAILNTFVAALVQVFPGTLLELLGVDVGPASAGTRKYSPLQNQRGTAIPRQQGPDLGEPQGTRDIQVTVEGDTEVVSEVTVAEISDRLERQSNNVEQQTGTDL